MHEISLAQRVIEELRGRDFSRAEIEVGALSLHGTEESRLAFEGMVQDAFPNKTITVVMLPPNLSCSCGATLNIMDGGHTLECPKCGKKMSVDTHEGYKFRLS